MFLDASPSPNPQGSTVPSEPRSRAVQFHVSLDARLKNSLVHCSQRNREVFQHAGGSSNNTYHELVPSQGDQLRRDEASENGILMRAGS